MLLHDLADRYGPAIVFFNVMGAALGLPVPAMPTLIVVGASVAMMGVNGQALLPHLALMLGIATLGGVLGDLVWFQGGRRYGDRTLKTICKLSLSRDTCVKKTERFFGRWGVRVLLVAKFIPGLSLVSVPLAGAMGVRMRSFIAHDGVGVALWAAVGLAVGVIFAAELDMVFAMIAQLGKQALLVVAVAGVLRGLPLLAPEDADEDAGNGAHYCRRAVFADGERTAPRYLRYPFRRKARARSLRDSRLRFRR